MKMTFDSSLNDYVCHGERSLLRVTGVEPAANYTLRLTFSTGERRTFDAAPLLSDSLFAHLKNPALFMRARLDGISVMWDDETDLDPQYLYDHSAG